MLKKYRYKIYGLTVESELEIPQAVPTLEDMNGIVADVEIVYGEIPEWLKKAGEEGAENARRNARKRIPFPAFPDARRKAGA